ncbi:MAG: hypothetical protein U0271_25580 [Polyangiaceae bacterium]
MGEKNPPRRARILLAAALAVSCGGAPTGRLEDGDPRKHLVAPADNVELVRLDGHPPLAAVVREGDPASVVAVALHAHGDPLALVALGEVVRQRAAADGVELRIRVDEAGLVADARVGDDPAPTITTLARALATLHQLDEATRAAIDARPARAARPEPRARRGSRVPRPACSTPTTSSSQATLRASRPRASPPSPRRASFAIVGSAALLAIAPRALSDTAAWPASPTPLNRPTLTNSGSAGASLVSIDPNLDSGRARITAAVGATFGCSTSCATASAGACCRRGRIVLLLSSASSRRPTLTVAASPSPSRACSPRRRPRVFTDLAATAERELGVAIASGPPTRASQPTSRAPRARDTADLAWCGRSPRRLAPRPRRGPRGPAALALEVAPTPAAGERDPIASALAAGHTRAAALPETRVRLERGQGETWVLVANLCAPLDEPLHSGARPRRPSSPPSHALVSAPARAPPPRLTSPAASVRRARPALLDEDDGALLKRPGTPVSLQFLRRGRPQRGPRRRSRGARFARSSGGGVAALLASGISRPRSATRRALEPFGPPQRTARFDADTLGEGLTAPAESSGIIGACSSDGRRRPCGARGRLLDRPLEPCSTPAAARGLLGDAARAREERRGPAVSRAVFPAGSPRSATRSQPSSALSLV